MRPGFALEMVLEEAVFVAGGVGVGLGEACARQYRRQRSPRKVRGVMRAIMYECV